jgi:fermentation-respiration switch protein FrsA (DUF1100 family)
MQESVVFANEGQRIFGTVHVPQGGHKPPFPALVMLHGFTGQRVEPHQLFVKASRRFADLGILTVRFDFRGCGESQGNFEDISIEGQMGDVHAALKFVRNRYDVVKERIGLLGLSLGGAIAASVAGQAKAGIHCLVLWAAVADLRQTFNSRAPENLVSNLGKQKIHDYFGNALSQRYLDELFAFHPVERVRAYGGSALIVHGDADESVSLDDAKRYEQALRNGSDVALHIIEGADHTFAGLSWEKELINTTSAFFKRHLIQ